MASVENAAENAKNVENKGLPLNVIVALPQEKLPVAAIGRVGAHFSCGSSAAKIRRRSGAEGQKAPPRTLTLKGPGVWKREVSWGNLKGVAEESNLDRRLRQWCGT
jgi:hypothetical protein